MHSDDIPHYPACRRFFHWISAPLVLAALYTGFYFGGHLSWTGISNYRLHLTLGTMIFVLTLCRLLCVWRFPLVTSSKTLPERLAGYTHGFLYVLLLLQPALGIASKIGNGKPLVLAGGINIPPLLAKGSVPAGLLMEIHEAAGKILLITLGLHMAAALFHHLLLKDDVLRRMWPGLK